MNETNAQSIARNYDTKSEIRSKIISTPVTTTSQSQTATHKIMNSQQLNYQGSVLSLVPPKIEKTPVTDTQENKENQIYI